VKYFILMVLAFPLLAGCDQKQPPPSKESQRIQHYIEPLPSDAQHAISILLAHLASAVHRQGTVLIIQDRSLSNTMTETYAMPISTSWTVECGITGVDVTFGNLESPDGNDVDVTLSMASISDTSKCSAYAAAIGVALETLTGHT